MPSERNQVPRKIRVRQWAFVFGFAVVFVACAIGYAITGAPSVIAFWVGLAVAGVVIVIALRRERAARAVDPPTGS
jgi:cytochrome c biogenesis protein CcdA